MKKENCFYLGIIARKHSYKGEIVIVIDSDEPELYENIDAVFIEQNNKLIPYFIEEILLQKGNQLRIKFEDVDNEEDAEAILKRPTYLPLTLLPKLEGDKFYYHEIIGFDIEDLNYGFVGKIKAINDNSSQVLFIIESENNDILIPLIDEFIKKVDRKSKKIFVETPEGLIEMNVESSNS
ncbi:MAG: ribosome maturation factor RimM [Flavobacteriaceae bacterium]